MVQSATAVAEAPIDHPDTEGASTECERPSRHGMLMGQMLAKLERAGRTESSVPLPEPCLTCAFREGCMTNQMAATGVVALNCVLGIDKDEFACHHGMRDGWPTRICAGYVAAKLAPFHVTRETLSDLTRQLDAMDGPDEVRARFDAWVASIDPAKTMDDYQLARVYAASPPV